MSRASKRAAIWCLEKTIEALLLAVFLTSFWRTEGATRWLDDFGLTLGVAFVFMIGSGYLLTTALAAAFWRNRIGWIYPAIVGVLFALHVQFFADGWDLSTKLPVQGVGACIVIACAITGNQVLKQWVTRSALMP